MFWKILWCPIINLALIWVKLKPFWVTVRTVMTMLYIAANTYVDETIYGLTNVLAIAVYTVYFWVFIHFLTINYRPQIDFSMCRFYIQNMISTTRKMKTSSSSTGHIRANLKTRTLHQDVPPDDPSMTMMMKSTTQVVSAKREISLKQFLIG